MTRAGGISGARSTESPFIPDWLGYHYALLRKRMAFSAENAINELTREISEMPGITPIAVKTLDQQTSFLYLSRTCKPLCRVLQRFA